MDSSTCNFKIGVGGEEIFKIFKIFFSKREFYFLDFVVLQVGSSI